MIKLFDTWASRLIVGLWSAIIIMAVVGTLSSCLYPPKPHPYKPTCTTEAQDIGLCWG